MRKTVYHIDITPESATRITLACGLKLPTDGSYKHGFISINECCILNDKYFREEAEICQSCFDNPLVTLSLLNQLRL